MAIKFGSYFDLNTIQPLCQTKNLNLTKHFRIMNEIKPEKHGPVGDPHWDPSPMVPGMPLGPVPPMHHLHQMAAPPPHMMHPGVIPAGMPGHLPMMEHNMPHTPTGLVAPCPIRPTPINPSTEPMPMMPPPHMQGVHIFNNLYLQLFVNSYTIYFTGGRFAWSW